MSCLSFCRHQRLLPSLYIFVVVVVVDVVLLFLMFKCAVFREIENVGVWWGEHRLGSEYKFGVIIRSNVEFVGGKRCDAQNVHCLWCCCYSHTHTHAGAHRLTLSLPRTQANSHTKYVHIVYSRWQKSSFWILSPDFRLYGSECIIYMDVCVCVTACVSVANIIKFYLVLLIIVAELKSGFCFSGVCV